MKLDIIISVVGHVLVFIGLVLPSFLPGRPLPPEQVVLVRAVTPQSISRLLEKVEDVGTPKPKVPQVQVPKEKLIPDLKKPARKVQTVKREEKQAPVKSAPAAKPSGKTDKKGIELSDGSIVEQNVNMEYLASIIQIIRNNWRVPNLYDPAIKAFVFFEIGQNGKMLRIRVETRSGNMVFDKSAYDAVMKSNPFPALPDDFTGDKLSIHLAFRY